MSSYLTANGAGVSSARIALPLRGAWVGDLVMASDAPVSGPVTLATSDGALSLVGAVVRTGQTLGATVARLVGGAGGLQDLLRPKSYVGVPVRIPLLDMLAEGGETVSASADPSLLGRLMPSWTRLGRSLGACLGELVDQFAAGWRVAVDGTVWVGSETWPTVSPAYDLIFDSPHEARQELAMEAPSLLAGVTLGGRQVSYVEHRIEPGRMRTDVWYVQ